jgi:phosphopantothenoylcysteine decarboxylase/phosphopantothenate--cysteine ligase
LPEVPEIMAEIEKLLGKPGLLAGRKVVVTAGGTQEPLDPVRYIGNRSSGRMGYAIAEAALQAGAEVTLISGPVSLSPPKGAKLVKVNTAREMEAAVYRGVQDADALVMAAAVADYAPAQVSKQKIKKTSENLNIELARNPDILAGLAEMDLPMLVRVGFAAETQNLLQNAREKLERKRLDMNVANDAASSIGTESSVLTLVTKKGIEELQTLPKEESARILVQRLVNLIEERQQVQTGEKRSRTSRDGRG